jgi:tetratricopeptide (TPR) repeat protein
MKRTVIVLLAGFFISQPTLCSSLNWKYLHENAERMDVAAACALVHSEPYSIDALYILGLVNLNAHCESDAENTFHKILFLSPPTIEAQWGLAEILRRKHQIEESQDILNRLVKSHPEFSPAYISLAKIKFTQMDFVTSVELASKVIQRGTSNVDRGTYARAHLMIAGANGMIAHNGGLLSKISHGRSVLPNLKSAHKLLPDDPEVLFGLGSFYLLAPSLVGGSTNKALHYLGKAVVIDPLFADAYVRLAQAYKKKGDDGKYHKYLHKALEIDPQNVLAHDIESGECRYICFDEHG